MIIIIVMMMIIITTIIMIIIGFRFHHAKPDYVLLTHWLPDPDLPEEKAPLRNNTRTMSNKQRVSNKQTIIY